MSKGKVASLIDELSGELGDSVNTAMEVKHWLNTGFSPLNAIISGDYDGGMPGGRIVEMFGPPSCGKTAISTNVMASAISVGGFALYEDHERSFDIDLARNLGLDDSTGRFAHTKPKTLEESFTRSMKVARRIREEKMIPADAPIVAVFDSLAAMVPKSKVEKELGELSMHDSLALAKATSTVLPVVAKFAEEYDILVIMLNQLRENPGVTYGDNSRTPGGKAPGYYASVRIKLSASQLVDKNDGEKTRLGQQITAEIIKNKVARPFLKTKWNFLYTEEGSGKFDVTGGLIDHLKGEGKIETSGNYLLWDGKKYYRQGLIDLINEKGLVPELEKLCRA